MKSIKNKLRFAGSDDRTCDLLEYAGEAIESEFEQFKKKIEKQGYRVDELLGKIRSEIIEQDKKIEDIEAGIHNLFEMLKRRTKRIKALEKIHPFSLQDHRHTEKDPFPCDRYGKPPGGLKKWDVISYTALENKEKIVGEFHKGNRGEIWGYFHNWGSKPEGELYMVGADRVTFEFRPKPEKS